MMATAASGANAREQRVLVAYASEFGATQEVAEFIGQVLREAGANVEVRLVLDVTDLRPYQAVVLGSPIYNGAWLPEAIDFLQTFQEPLTTLPVAYFVISMTLRRDTPENRRAVRAYIAPVFAAAPRVRPVAVGLFAGRMRYRKLPLLTRLTFWLSARLPSGDYRAWTTIRTWTTAISPALLGEAKLTQPA
jgi:menaquinone-dependent protoporphyrinogen oxidase